MMNSTSSSLGGLAHTELGLVDSLLRSLSKGEKSDWLVKLAGIGCVGL